MIKYHVPKCPCKFEQKPLRTNEQVCEESSHGHIREIAYSLFKCQRLFLCSLAHLFEKVSARIYERNLVHDT